MNKLLSDILGGDPLRVYRRNDLLANNYKEASTHETIEYSKSTLLSLGFDIEEESVESGVGSYSHELNLILDGITVTISYGKGNTPEFARASAYGEMMESLQCDPNRTYRQFYALYNKDTLGLDDFVNYPDEKKEYDLDNYINKSEIVELIDSFKSEKASSDFREYAKHQINSYGYIPLARFTDSITGEDTYINEIFMRYVMLSSTGMCAGNTKYEALIQGLSEIIERYAKMRVFRDNLSLPIIPESELLGYAHYQEVQRGIRQSGRYYLEIRDASFNGKIPVVCAVLYDRVRRGYVVSFGSFPVFNIALDRTINELLQGQNISDVCSISEIIPYEAVKMGRQNIRTENKIVTADVVYDYDMYDRSNADNVANWPDEFFSEDSEFTYTSWGKGTSKTNEQLYYDTCNIVRDDLGDTVLYKDYTFLGLHAYSVICPKIACETFYSMKGYNLSMIYGRKEISDMLLGSEKIDTELLINTYESKKCYTNLHYLLGKATICEKLTNKIVESYVEFVKGNYTKSAMILSKKIPIIPFNVIDRNRVIDYWKCLHNYIGLMDTIKDTIQIKNFLYKIYDYTVVDDISKYCKDADTLANALFRDPLSHISLIDWDKEAATLESFKIIYNAKLDYFKNTDRG